MTSLLEHLSDKRLNEILDRCTDRTIGVVGDLGLDAYWYADMTRSFLSRETPLFPRPVVRECYSPGAGANVAHNLSVLGVGQVLVFSVLGDDWRGTILRQEMARCGIVVDHLVVSPQRNTTAFVKPMLMGYDSQQEDARLDFENAQPLPPALEEALVDVVTHHLPRLDGLLVADQLDVNGVITDRVREALNDLAAGYPDKLFVADSRQRIGLFRHMVLKPNWVEAAAAVYPDRDPRSVDRDELVQIGEALSQRSGRPVFVTLSEEGVLVCAESSHHVLPAAPVCPPLDPVGAGDAFVAALAGALAVGATDCEAGAVANLAAAITVEKLNVTGTASPEEILARYDLVRTLVESGVG
jgi:rfaE bifunctional protein kinase chain/domain